MRLDAVHAPPNGDDRMRTQPRAVRKALAVALFFVAASAPLALAQDETPPAPPKPGEETPLPPEGEMEAPGEGGMDEIAEIIKQIESHMGEAERLLTSLDASGAGAEQEAAAELLRKLLDQAGKQQSSALSSIDKLLEIAAKQSEQQQQQGGKSGKKRSESDRKREQEERERKAKEELARKEKGEDKPEDGGKSEDEPTGKEKDGKKKPADSESERARNTDVAGRWGSLPPALRDRIEQGKWDGFPPEYREKLAKWYKRINAEEK